ncbi:MAG TPA: MFS transporter [Acidimicrobiia bacterium]|nr:MFS transporter [Acidimicrobiia bacterium]
MSADQQAPFIPSSPDAAPVPPAPWRVFGTRSYFRLWLAQVVSSTGDWIGLVAILAIAARVSHNSGAAVSLVMTARVVPGFFLATLGGVIIDRLDRRRVMVWCDIGRATLLALLPLADSLAWLVVISFALEILTLLWGPAKDASVPNLVEPEQLASANTLSLVASYGTFPFAALIFSLLAALAGWLGSFHALHGLSVDQETLALFADAATFLVSALIVWRLPIRGPDRGPEHHADLSGTFREIKEGMRFIANEPRVRGVIVGLGLGLIGGGAMIPLGPVFAKEALGGDSATFGALMTALGLGAAAGVIALLVFQKRLPRETVFEVAVMGTGIFLVLAATLSSLGPAALAVGLVGACAGTSYVTGFTTLQERVSDELRGRTFATLYTVIRMCLLISLVISPLWADFWDWVTRVVVGANQTVTLGGADYAFPGVRIALWGGGLITLFAGWFARWSVRRPERGTAHDHEAPPDRDAAPRATGAPPKAETPSHATPDSATG